MLSLRHHLDLFSELYHSNHKNITCITHLVRTRNPTLECSLEDNEHLRFALEHRYGLSDTWRCQMRTLRDPARYWTFEMEFVGRRGPRFTRH